MANLQETMLPLAPTDSIARRATSTDGSHDEEKKRSSVAESDDTKIDLEASATFAR